LPRRHARLMVGTAVLAAIAVLGYFSYRQRPLVNAPEPRAASSEASGRGGPAGAGVIRRDAAAGDTAQAKADDSARPTGPATPPPAIPGAGPTRAAVNQPRADRKPVESREAKAGAAATARSQAINAGRVREGGASRPVVCTESVAALGLCPPDSIQTKEAETAAAIKSPIARRRANAASKVGGQEPPRQEACTEAVAALGLCTPGPTQRRE